MAFFANGPLAMARFMRSGKINRLPIVVGALACFCTSALAQVIYIVPSGRYPFAGERVIRLDIEKAIRRALTPPSRPAAPPFQSAVPPPSQAAAPQQETREQWRQRLFDETRSSCTQYPTDTACGPNALSGGSEKN
jgi:hypothetical protein